MNFIARFRHKNSQEDISYYVEELGEPILFEQAQARLYFVATRLEMTRIGPTLRGEVLLEAEAQTAIEGFRRASDWQEINTPFR